MGPLVFFRFRKKSRARTWSNSNRDRSRPKESIKSSEAYAPYQRYFYLKTGIITIIWKCNSLLIKNILFSRLIKFLYDCSFYLNHPKVRIIRKSLTRLSSKFPQSEAWKFSLQKCDSTPANVLPATTQWKLERVFQLNSD